MIKNKKIIFVGFYDDFARFYQGVSRELDSDCYFVFQNISGYLYSLVRNFRKTYLFFRLKNLFFQDTKSSRFPISDEDLIYILEYCQVDSRYRKFIVKQLYWYWYKKISRLGINTILIAGDSRPISRIFKLIGQKLNCKLFFFEQGPFNTTILDPKGVNANCSFRDLDKDSYVYSGKYSLEKKVNYKRNLIYRFLDYLYDFFFLSAFIPIFSENNIQKAYRAFFTRQIIKKFKFIKYDYKKKFILLILQVPDDANMVLHSPHFSSSFEMVKSIHKALPNNFQLLIREHPLYKFGYEPDVYSFIQSHTNVFLDSNSPLKDQINKASLVIVNNSTVGFETLFSKKRLMILGDSYYDKYRFSIKLKSLKNIDKEIKDALSIEIDKSEANSYIAWNFSKNFIKGHFRNSDISLLCKRISKLL
tara:strand:+ start:3720 stop:4973 length:1254 start_codon:yes stop_codon:yes gene_type:complete